MTKESSNFYTTGGTLRPNAPSYVERQADRDLHSGLLEGEFCYVLTSRQMGKSSLMVRTATRLQEGGVNVILLDLTAIGQNLTPEQWYDGLLMRLGKEPAFVKKLEDAWATNKRLGPCQRFFTILREVVLPSRPGPFVIFVDEIDTVRSLPFSTDEFFSAIRECYNRRGEDHEFQRLTFCLLGVATPSDLIRDTRTTPFNIGRRVELHDFTEAEATPLAHGLQQLASLRSARTPLLHGTETSSSLRRAKRLLSRIMHWTGGHPYLTQRFCRAAAEQAKAMDSAGVDDLCEELFLSNRARERDDNLLFVHERLLRSEADLPSLLELYLKVRRGRRIADDDTNSLISVLRLSGIVKAVDGCLTERNRIYSRVFDGKWVQAHLPDADVRRQKAAFQRGVIRTTAVSAVVIAAMSVAVLFALNRAAEARKALAKSYFSHAKALRVSGLAGQRYQSLQALNQARRYHTNEVELRDEALACLALVDLRETTNGIILTEKAGALALSPSLEISAVADESGTITLRKQHDGQMLATLVGSNLPIEQLRFSPMETVLLAEYHGTSGYQLVVWDWKNERRLFATAHRINGNAVDFSADDRKLAVGGPDGRVVVHALPGGEVMHEIELKRESGSSRAPQSVRFHPSGNLLAICSLDDHYVEVWNLSATQRVARPYHLGVVHDISWHPRGQSLAAACGDSRVYLWQTNDFENAKKLAGHEGSVTAVAFNNRGTQLASLGNDQTVRLWVSATARQMLGGAAGETFDRLQFSADDRHLVAAGLGRLKPRVWEAFGDELTVLQVEGGRGYKLRAIDFAPDSRWLLAASGKQITIWDADSGRELGAIPLPNVRGAWFAGDGRHLVASSDKGLFKWALLYEHGDRSPRLQFGVMQRMYRKLDQLEMTTHLEWAERLTSDPNHKALDELGMMSLSFDRMTAALVHNSDVLLVPLEPPHGPELRTNRLGTYYPQLALHPQGEWLATRTGDSDSLHLWNMKVTAGNSAPATVPSSEHYSFSPDGKWLATSWEGKFRFYQVGMWKEPAFAVQRTLASDRHAPVAFSCDGRTVAMASSRYSIQLRKLPESGKDEAELIATLESPDRFPLEILAFSRDGRRLAAATDGQIIQLWNLALLHDGLAALNLHRTWPEPP